MSENIQSYFDFEKCFLFKGFPPSRLKRPENIEDYEQVKIAGIGHIKNMIETNETSEIPSNYFRLEKKHKKDYCYIQQGDIVIPALAATNNLSILYVENEPDEKILYNATVFVIRPLDTSIAKYLYIMLKSEHIHQSILKLAYRENAVISYRMTLDVIKSLKIPMLDKKQRDKIVDEYDQVQHKKLEAQKQEYDFWHNVNELEELDNIQ